jgi:hypothetical protein
MDAMNLVSLPGKTSLVGPIQVLLIMRIELDRGHSYGLYVNLLLGQTPSRRDLARSLSCLPVTAGSLSHMTERPCWCRRLRNDE